MKILTEQDIFFQAPLKPNDTFVLWLMNNTDLKGQKFIEIAYAEYFQAIAYHSDTRMWSISQIIDDIPEKLLLIPVEVVISMAQSYYDTTEDKTNLFW